jgi:Flp pilus assembly protein TadD
MMRFRNPSDFSLTDRGDGKYSYSVEARVRVFDADGKLLFTQLKTVADTIDRGQFADIKEKRFGYEGSLPLPPGKYHLDFLLTDWQKKAAFQAEKDVVVPPIGENDFVISGVLPFSQAAPADPATADVTPFALAGVKFTPLGTAPLILSPADSLQVAYQIWTAPKDPRAYAGSVLNVEYALGRPAVPGGATLVTDQVNKEQFDPAGSLVNGKRFSLDAESTGNYMLTVTLKQGATSGPAFTSLNFSVLGNAPVIGVWDISDPSLQKDLQTGLADQDRALVYLAQGKKDEARVWFRRALDRDRTNDVARARLVDAYYAQKDYAAVISLYKDAGITPQTDSESILRVAQSFRESGDLPKAIAVIESALSTRAEEGPLYLALAGYYDQAGNAQKAAEARRKGRSLLNPPAGAK